MAYNVAVDVGGTFTDVLLFDEQTGELTDTKVLSTTETRLKAWSPALSESAIRWGSRLRTLDFYFTARQSLRT